MRAQQPLGGQELEQEPEEPDFAKLFEIPETWKRLGEKNPIWIDRQQHLVIVGGQICLTRGLLEMFACPRRTREHESIVSVHVPSRIVHAALLAVGAKPGSPVQFDPEYKPASGPKVDIRVRWMDDGKSVERRAQEMMRQVSNKEPMKDEFVFGGSLRWKDESTGTEYYSADGGELVCVSNFGNATIDLPVPSTAANAGLLFEADPDKIPPLGTPVLLILRPEVAAGGEKTDADANLDGKKGTKLDGSSGGDRDP
jgi:hypothetical protein